VEITEVRIKLMEEASERLQAFCSITFDNSFVIRDLKIIDGSNGPFVAMPSRKLTAHCPSCGCKNHLRAAHCNQCGSRLNEDRFPKDEDGRAKLYADIAHPINSACREMIQERVIREFRIELDRSKLPGYKPSYDDYDHDLEIAAPVERTREPAAKRTMHVQPAEPQPRSPHKLPNLQQNKSAGPHTPPTAQREITQEGFGAGIF